MKKIISAVLASVMLIAAVAPAFAAPTDSTGKCSFKDAKLCTTGSIYSGSDA